MKSFLSFVIALCVLCATASAFGIRIPMVKGRKTPYNDQFQPATLPCAYTALFSVYAKDAPSGTEQNAQGYQAMYGRYIATKVTQNPQGVVSTVYYILRLDIQEEGHPDSAALMIGQDVPDYHMTMCQFDDYEDPYTDGYKYGVLYYLFNSSFPYDTKKEGVKYNGEDCTLYSITQQGVSAQLYANAGNYIVGYTASTNTYYGEINISYKMNTKAEYFMLDSSFKGCEDYPKIYQAPAKEPNCDI